MHARKYRSVELTEDDADAYRRTSLSRTRGLQSRRSGERSPKHSAHPTSSVYRIGRCTFALRGLEYGASR